MRQVKPRVLVEPQVRVRRRSWSIMRGSCNRPCIDEDIRCFKHGHPTVPVVRSCPGKERSAGLKWKLQERGELCESNRPILLAGQSLRWLTFSCPSSSPGRHSRTLVAMLPKEPSCIWRGSSGQEMENTVEAKGESFTTGEAAMAADVESGGRRGGQRRRWGRRQLWAGGRRPAGTRSGREQEGAGGGKCGELRRGEGGARWGGRGKVGWGTAGRRTAGAGKAGRGTAGRGKVERQEDRCS